MVNYRLIFWLSSQPIGVTVKSFIIFDKFDFFVISLQSTLFFLTVTMEQISDCVPITAFICRDAPDTVFARYPAGRGIWLIKKPDTGYPAGNPAGYLA
jgi:hypothetical protein